jgi:hypothetical protein
LARWILTESGRHDVTHDALVNLIGFDAGTLDGLANRDSAELRRTEIGEAALKFSDGCAAAGDDDNIVKRGHESSSHEDFATFIIDAPTQECVAAEWPQHAIALKRCRAIHVVAGEFNMRNDVFKEGKIQSSSMQSAKNFLTFASENSLFVTLVSQLAKVDHHFFLDFIFH